MVHARGTYVYVKGEIKNDPKGRHLSEHYRVNGLYRLPHVGFIYTQPRQMLSHETTHG